MMHQGVMSKDSANFAHPVWVRQRELRQRMSLGHTDDFHKGLYSSIKPCFSWDGGENSGSAHGGIFSLEFSPKGSLLVAACEKKCFLVFDPLSQKLIHTVKNAHECCLTTVKFLKSDLFATGSIDRTVSLWDVRNLKSRYGILRGHSSAIGNIEYSPKNNLLITSSLDGIIYTWDVENCAETEDCSRKIFRSFFLIRLRLSHDESKMIISTARGYLLIVHDLDLTTIAEDLDEFQTAMFEIASLGEASAPPAPNADRFPSPRRRTNRIEVVEDFPSADGFNVISSLEIHPQGGSALSRSTNKPRGLEWTCVHDIRERWPNAGRWEAALPGERAPAPWVAGCSRDGTGRAAVPPCRDRHESDRGGASSSGSSGDNAGNENYLSTTDESSDSEWEDWQWSLQPPNAAPPPDAASPPDAAASPPEGGDWPERIFYHVPSARVRPAPLAPPIFPDQAPTRDIPAPSEPLAPFSAFPSRAISLAFTHPYSGEPFLNRTVHGYTPRMTHYIEEPVLQEWYIEDLCFSADGRLICSPFDCGIRLLSFSPQCTEHSVSCSGREPIRLHELNTYISHNETVLRTRFSPRHLLLVSGCVGGKLAWYQPVV